MNHGSSGLRLAMGAVGGGAVAMIIGAIWMALASDNGFADLAAAAVTRVVLIPLGMLLGIVFVAVSRRSRETASWPDRSKESTDVT